MPAASRIAVLVSVLDSRSFHGRTGKECRVFGTPREKEKEEDSVDMWL